MTAADNLGMQSALIARSRLFLSTCGGLAWALSQVAATRWLLPGAIAMGAAEMAGVVARANWNNAVGAARSTPLPANASVSLASMSSGVLSVSSTSSRCAFCTPILTSTVVLLA